MRKMAPKPTGLGLGLQFQLLSQHWSTARPLLLLFLVIPLESWRQEAAAGPGGWWQPCVPAGLGPHPQPSPFRRKPPQLTRQMGTEFYLFHPHPAMSVRGTRSFHPSGEKFIISSSNGTGVSLPLVLGDFTASKAPEPPSNPGCTYRF